MYDEAEDLRCYTISDQQKESRLTTGDGRIQTYDDANKPPIARMAGIMNQQRHKPHSMCHHQHRSEDGITIINVENGSCCQCLPFWTVKPLRTAMSTCPNIEPPGMRTYMDGNGISFKPNEHIEAPVIRDTTVLTRRLEGNRQLIASETN